jgi:hypothetical protein
MATNLEDRLNRWEILNANLKNHLEEMPDMKAKQAEFEQIIDQDLAMAAQFNQANATARGIIRQRRELARKGNQLRNILVAALQHRFGPENQQLGEFGVRPRVAVRRKKEAPKPDPTVTSAPTAHDTQPAPAG